MTRYHEKFSPTVRKPRPLPRRHPCPTVVHLGYGYPGGAGQQHEYEYSGTARRVDENTNRRLRCRVRAQQLRPAVLAIAKGRIVMFGCVDPSDTPCRRWQLWSSACALRSKYIEPNKLWLAPDCGLMTIVAICKCKSQIACRCGGRSSAQRSSDCAAACHHSCPLSGGEGKS